MTKDELAEIRALTERMVREYHAGGAFPHPCVQGLVDLLAFIDEQDEVIATLTALAVQ